MTVAVFALPNWHSCVNVNVRAVKCTIQIWNTPLQPLCKTNCKYLSKVGIVTIVNQLLVGLNISTELCCKWSSSLSLPGFPPSWFNSSNHHLRGPGGWQNCKIWPHFPAQNNKKRVYMFWVTGNTISQNTVVVTPKPSQNPLMALKTLLSVHPWNGTRKLLTGAPLSHTPNPHYITMRFTTLYYTA